MRLALAIALAAGCARRPPQAVEPDPPSPSRLELQQQRAAEEGPSQTLEVVRLASIALAEGQRDTAEAALRRAVVRMQDFRAEGQFRAMVGAESRKEWKGDPYEKMMAFLYLGVLLLEEGDYGNALAMTKSAILADTGTSRFQYRADFVPAFVLQAIVYERLGERTSAERSLQQAVDAMYLRELTTHLTDRLAEVQVEGQARKVDAARLLLMSSLPAGLSARPRDPLAAVDATLSRATELRGVLLDGKPDDWPEDLQGVLRRDLRDSFEVLDPLVVAWRGAIEAQPLDLGSLAEAEADLQALLDDDPSVLLFVEGGRGPRKAAYGEYREILRYEPREPAPFATPKIRLDGAPVDPTYLDSVSYQASTRGARWVDGFLAGKAQFKDAAPVLGWSMMVAGDVARAVDDDSPVAAVLYLFAAITWIAGAATNPAADVRAWNELPETLWLVVADPPPGRHRLLVDGREYGVDVPDRGTVVQLIPSLPPGGPTTFGEPCVQCPAPAEATGPLAIPAPSGSPPGDAQEETP